jgi:cation diffusion facilitator CzcD-associated flavoprotein CzcO
MNPAQNNRHIYDTVIIGSGFAGTCMAIKLKEEGNEDFIVLEKDDKSGGTWQKNNYPGAACDVPSHLYSFSFAPNPNWSRVYSPQPEIEAYHTNVIDQYGIKPFIRTGQRVITVRHDGQVWHIEIDDCETLRAHHVVLGSGTLDQPNIPAINGLDDFVGLAFHSAQWDPSIDLTNKKVVVIGSAASAIQIVPELAKKVEHLTLFQRTANYIAPRNDRAYTRFEKTCFTLLPFTRKLLRSKIFIYFDYLLFLLFGKRPWMRNIFTRSLEKFRRNSLNTPELLKQMTPTYELGCKRILVSDNYYTSLNRDNVTVTMQGIDKITTDGLTDKDGNNHAADVIIFATGFNVNSHYRSINIVGHDQKDPAWLVKTQAYRGVFVKGAPNLYFITGPNTYFGSASTIFLIETQVHYIFQAMKHVDQQQLLTVKDYAFDKYNHDLSKDLGERVWASGCDSWYLNKNGTNDVLYPNRATSFWRERRKFDIDNFTLVNKKTIQKG